MKNFDLLLLDDIQMQRVKKFAEMHQRYGGIIIDVIAFDKESNQALIRILDRKGTSSPEQLVQKANEVFRDEVPDHWRLYYTTMEEEGSKYYLTWDKRYVVRVHKYFAAWEIVDSDGVFVLMSTIPTVFLDKVSDSEKTAEIKASKWLRNYLITNKVEL